MKGEIKQESCTMARKLSLICSYLFLDSTAFVIHFPVHNDGSLGLVHRASCVFFVLRILAIFPPLQSSDDKREI